VGILSFPFMQNALAAAILGGAACGMIGVLVVVMQVPFVGVAMAHAAFAGAVFAVLFGMHPMLLALAFCMATAVVIGPLSDRAQINPSVSLGIVFSLVLGLAFLGMGMISGPKTHALQFIWGHILTVSRRDVYFLLATMLVVLSFVTIFYKEVRAILFHREIAASVGIPERPLYYTMLCLAGLVVTLNLNTLGGLLIFCLIINPAAAAYQLTYSLGRMFFYSALFGILASTAGLFISYVVNGPTGGVIIVTSSIIFIVAFLCSPKRRVRRHEP
jgi:manganese/iron transport system permease protein